MEKLLLALCFLVSFTAHSAVPAKLNYKEYRDEIKRLAAECEAKGMPHFNGLCVSQKYDKLTDTALSVALEAHRYEFYITHCEHSSSPNSNAVLNYAFKIEGVKLFFQQMASQSEALGIYSSYFNDCKTQTENNAEIAKRIQWFANMAARYSDEGKELATQEKNEQRRIQSQTELALRESDPWFVGKFSGAFTIEGGGGSWSLNCSMSEKCDLLMKQSGTSAQAIPMRVPIRRDVAIPNNNLNGTRQAALARPELYEDKNEGVLLSSLRDLVGSHAKFQRCVDIAAEYDVVLCSLSTDPRASKSLVLLFGTMKSACGSSPFCAYYYQVLRREN